MHPLNAAATKVATLLQSLPHSIPEITALLVDRGVTMEFHRGRGHVLSKNCPIAQLLNQEIGVEGIGVFVGYDRCHVHSLEEPPVFDLDMPPHVGAWIHTYDSKPSVIEESVHASSLYELVREEYEEGSKDDIFWTALDRPELEAAGVPYNDPDDEMIQGSMYELAREDSITNQCDGCRRGLPLVDGVHRGEGVYDLIGCTKDRYQA